MSVVGYDIQSVLENTLPNPLRSVRKALISSAFGIGVATACALIWPFFLWYFVGMGVIQAVLVVATWRSLHAARQDEQQLLKDRKYTIQELPQHPEDRADWAHDERYGFGTRVPARMRKARRLWYAPWRVVPAWKPRGRYWFLTGCPHRRVAVRETVHHRDGTTRTRGMYRRVVVAERLPALMRLRDHLREHHEPVHAAVVSWWERHVRNRVLEELWPGRGWAEISKEAQKEVRDKSTVEFLEGVCIALRPETWERKFDKRPSHRAYSELRLLLWKQFLRDGEYPNRERLQGVPWIRVQKCKWVYVGLGAQWHGRHASKFYYEKFRDPDKIKGRRDPKADGDTRLMAMVWRELGSQFVQYDSLAKHSLVAGGSGMGKTRAVEAPLVAAIVNGGSLVVLDPKIDNRLVALMAHYARLYGREDDFQFLNIANPHSPYNNTFNPMFGTNQAVEYGSRVGALLPESGGENQFFIDESKRVGRIAASVADGIYKYLVALGGAKGSIYRPPKALLWLAFCKARGVDPAQGPQALAEAKAQFEELHNRLWQEGSTFAPRNDAEAYVGRMWASEHYRAESWIPSYQHVMKYACQRPWRLVSWGARLVHWHLLADHPEFNDLEWPEVDEEALVTGGPPTRGAGGEEKKETLVQYLQKRMEHPLEVPSDGAQREYLKRWRPLFEVMVPREDVVTLRKELLEFRRIFDEHLATASNAARDPESFKKYTATLDAPISLITAGASGRLLSDPNPDITWRRIHEEKKIVYLGTAVMVDRDVSSAISKTVTMSLMNYGGRVNADGGADIDLMFIGDEMPSWMTKDWSDVVDKLRGSGVRTMNMTQSMAGLRAIVGNADLIMHVYTNLYTKFQFATQSKEDCKNFVEGLPKVHIYGPKRSVSETPGLGDTGAKQVGSFSVSETRSLEPQEISSIDEDVVSRLPIGQCFLRQAEKVFIIQTPYLENPATNYMAEVGMDRSRNTCEIDGIDYGVESETVGESWGSAASLEEAQQELLNGSISAEDLDAQPVALKPGATNKPVDMSDMFLAAASAGPVSPATATTVAPAAEEAVKDDLIAELLGELSEASGKERT